MSSGAELFNNADPSNSVTDESHESAAAEAARLCAEGYAFLEDRQFAEARAHFERARTLAPDNPAIHYNLGLLFQDLGRARDALAAFDAALRLNPGDAKTHNNRGSALQILGLLREAGDAFQRALDLRPDLELPYINLGKLREQQRQTQDAIAIYDLAIARGLDRELFGQYRAAASGESTQRSPDSWVSSTFDNFAPTFDAHLAKLHYTVPRELAALLLRHAKRSLSILDLGCGTGQVGAALAGHGHRLTGVDLSPKMLAQARARNHYEQLELAEIHSWLQAAATESFDAVCAADVLIYIGALETLFREAARILRKGGWFAFSTEECSGVDFKLLATGRYAQSEQYVRRLAGESFAVLNADPTNIRIESGAPLPGRLYLLLRH
jgi:predicted TPR repeat methyltransferase